MKQDLLAACIRKAFLGLFLNFEDGDNFFFETSFYLQPTTRHYITEGGALLF
jgi:hypothetical protein